MEFEKIGKVLGNFASVTAKKAGEQAKITKLGIERAGVEKQIEGVYAAMGRYCYSRALAGEEIPPELLEYCRDIDILMENLNVIDEAIGEHKTQRDDAEYNFKAESEPKTEAKEKSATANKVKETVTGVVGKAVKGAELVKDAVVGAVATVNKVPDATYNFIEDIEEELGNTATTTNEVANEVVVEESTDSVEETVTEVDYAAKAVEEAAKAAEEAARAVEEALKAVEEATEIEEVIEVEDATTTVSDTVSQLVDEVEQAVEKENF